MTKFVKFTSAGIIILALVFGVVVGCKVTEHIRLSIRQDLQGAFKDELSKYGNR